MKWIIVAIAAFAALLMGFGLYYAFFMNPRVVEELRSSPQSERANKVMLLTFPDGKQLPVNYLREGDKVFAGADGPWWRAFRGDGAPVTILIQGKELRGTAVAILDDPAYTKDVFSRLRPDVPKWLPDWANGKLVEITLESQ